MTTTENSKEVLHTKPLKKNYTSHSAITQMMNANEGTDKFCIVDNKRYASDLEKYVAHLEAEINDLEDSNRKLVEAVKYCFSWLTDNDIDPGSELATIVQTAINNAKNI